MGYLRIYSNINEYNNDVNRIYYPNVCLINDTENLMFDGKEYYNGLKEDNIIELPDNLESGEYILVYEDKDNNILDNFSNISILSNKEYQDFIKENCAPYLADHIGVYDNNYNKLSNISIVGLKPKYGKRLYRFGLLSDVHNAKASIINDDQDFQNALKFFNEKEDVNFTCICGDITENGSETQLNNYKTNVDTYSPNTPVYTCTGNHDCSGFNDETWEQYTGCKRCFSFMHNNDVFVFLSMRYWSLGSSGTPYLEEDIDWLEDILKENENKRVFIFTHLFFPDKAGNFNEIYPSGNWLGGKQLERLNRLNELYLNAIWFGGHSHWMWYLQYLNDKANIYRSFSNNKPTCGWTVHLPSCAKPIDSNGTTRDDGDESDACSEGAIVDIYENYIIVRGISFKSKTDSNYNTKYLPIAQYKLDTNIIKLNVTESTKPVEVEPFITDYITSNDCTINTSKYSGCTVTQENDYVVFNFTRASQGFYIKPNNYTTDMTCSLIIDDITYQSPIDWTTNMKSKVGFYNGSGYEYTTDAIVRTDENGIQFNLSSSYPGDLPVIIKIKFKLKFY